MTPLARLLGCAGSTQPVCDKSGGIGIPPDEPELGNSFQMALKGVSRT
jgi:hypothetical protein